MWRAAQHLALGLLTMSLAIPAPAAEVSYDFNHIPDRVWIGEEFWSNPMEDWQVKDGRLEVRSHGQDRNVHCLTHDLAGAGDFSVRVRFGAIDPEASLTEGRVGFKIGAKGRFNDYRDSAVRGKGLHAGVTTDGRLFIGEPSETAEHIAEQFSDLSLTLKACQEDGVCMLRLVLVDNVTSRVIGDVRTEVSPDALTGNLALVCDGKNNIWFDDWTLGGEQIASHPDRAFGPILFAQHTLSRGVLKMSVQMPPLGETDPKTVALHINDGGRWREVAEADIDPLSCTACFRIEGWDDTSVIPYRLFYPPAATRLVHRSHVFHGTIRPNPVNKDTITIAAFTGNNDVGFPHADIVRNVSHFHPDLLVYTGDQIYEGVGGYGVAYQPLDRACISYLRKWIMFGWEYRDLLRDTPSVCLPDDHDVFHGNVWGAGGKATDPGTGMGAKAQDTGGYKMPPEFVNMVQRTQTSHHPDPYDPTPVEQGIGVYYGPMNYGGVSFAIIEDRKFKSAPQVLLPEAEIHNGWAQNFDFDSAKDGDAPGAVLLSDRQLRFLKDWAQDWSNDAWMKVVISQTIFANVATLPREVHHDNVTPRLKIWPVGEYAPDEKPVQDHDSNGWPQAGRNRALREMRRAFAFHIAGDQHLGSTIQYGIDDWNDAGWAICVPSVANVWPRRWFPPVPGDNREPGAPKYTGEFIDGFGNRITVHAVSNPHAVDAEPKDIMQRAPGFGIIELKRDERSITMTNWPRWVDPSEAGAEPYPGWPITIHQLQNYGRQATAFLPTLEITGATDPVVQVEDEVTGEIVYTLRIQGDSFRPPVFSEGPFTVRVGLPDDEVWRATLGVRPAPSDDVALDFNFTPSE